MIFVMYSKGNNKNKSSMARKANNPTTLKKLVLLSLIVLVGFLPKISHCQGWEVTFGAEKTDEGRAIIQSKDLGYIAIGVSNSFGEDNDRDIYIVRTDVDATVIWSQFYDEGINEDATSAIELEDGSIVIAGYIETTIQDNPDVYLLKISNDGQLIWSKTFETSLDQKAFDLQLTSDGGFILAGTTAETDTVSNPKMDAMLMKVDASGTLEWMESYGFEAFNDNAKAVTILDDGYVFTGTTENQTGSDTDIYLVRVNNQGAVIWTKMIGSELNGTNQADYAEDVLLAQDGNLIIAGSRYFAGQAYLAKLDLDGEIIWETEFGDEMVDYLEDAILLPEGDIAVTGRTEPSGSELNTIVARIDDDGTVEWFKGIGESGFITYGVSIAPNEVGGFVVTGYNGVASANFNDLVIIKTDDQGTINSSEISGRVFIDDPQYDNFCQLDPEETLLEEWLIKAESEDETYFTTTDENGYYHIFVDTGFYNVSVLPINDLWEPCIPSYNVNVTEFYEIIDDRDFPVFEGTNCPFMITDISSPYQIPNPCTDVTYEVDYCNYGTANATDVTVRVFLDSELTYNGNSLGQTPTINGPFYTFELGNVDINECGEFEIYTSVSCDGIVDGQSIMVSAQIFPDTICEAPDPEWDGSSLKVDGTCDLNQDSVKFTIENIGDDMDGDLNYIVIQDDVVLLLQTEDGLTANAMLETGVDNNGSTYRIIAEQAPGHPGNSYPTVAVEGCVEEGGDYSTGYVTQFQEDDGNPFISIDVQEIIVGSGQAALLRGYPKGYGEENRLTANTDITYTYKFENVGTDTINRVVIRDTISPYLDITTATPGTSSHPYDFRVYDNGILKVTFSDIALLPGGSAEEAQSTGFIKIRISQKPNLPEETVIENRAAVFFDYHEPVLTEMIRHKVACEDFFESFENQVLSSCIGIDPTLATSTESEPNKVSGFTIKMQPNPFNESTVFTVEGRELKELEFSVYDMMGRLIHQELHQANSFTYYRNQMPAGLYIYRLESEGQLIDTGKMVIR